jgi:competence protein ComGC
MKTRCSNQRSPAMTLTEVLVVIVVLVVLAALLLPALATARHHSGPTCVTNIKQIWLSFEIWAGDNNGKFPMEVPLAEGGAKELAAAGNAVAIFQVMSNELSTPKVLVCQMDKGKTFATNFGSDLTTQNVSYFVGLDTDTNHLQPFLSGDDNFTIDGAPVKSGLLELSTNSPIAWASGRHTSYNSHFWTSARNKFYGNVGFSDGSVGSLNVQGLQQSFQNTGVATNRFAIP